MPSAAPAEGRPRRLSRSERREAIVKGAGAAFVASGFAATSMEDVAAAAGITRLIVYRHFDSKEALYDAVLEQVSVRLWDAFTERMHPGAISSGAAEAMLSVARQDPSGFTLLWRHAAREERFAPHADLIRSRVVVGAEELLVSLIPASRDGRSTGIRRWAAATLVAYLVEAVLAWLDEGEPGEDRLFVAMTGRSLPALVRAWGPDLLQLPRGELSAGSAP